MTISATFPQTWVKDGKPARIARKPSDAVEAKFAGYRCLETDSISFDYRELQRQAKERGIPANQSAEALIEALTAPETPTDGPTPADPQNDPQDPAPAKPDTDA